MRLRGIKGRIMDTQAGSHIIIGGTRRLSYQKAVSGGGQHVWVQGCLNLKFYSAKKVSAN